LLLHRGNSGFLTHQRTNAKPNYRTAAKLLT
jgi:hypothetical protein